MDIWIVLTLAGATAGALGFLVGQWISPSAKAYREELLVQKGRIKYLNQQLRETIGEEQASPDLGGLGGALGSLVGGTSGSGIGEIIKLVADNPDLLKNILGSLGKGGGKKVPNDTVVLG